MKQALLAMFVFSLIGGAAIQAGAEDRQAPDKPLELKSSASQKMWVKFDHASHESIDCDVCHHAEPSEGSRYVSCGANEECHSIKGKERDVQSQFWAYHTKSSERSCYGCHSTMEEKG